VTPQADPDHAGLRGRAAEAVRILQSAGFTAYWAGGCVRDILMGKSPKDYDIATSATPDEVLGLFPRSKAVGKAFGVVRAPMGGEFFEIATFRKDHAYVDGRRPSAVSFTDAETDAQRRDFTVNAMFHDPVADALHDFVGGRADIDARTIRCVGDPAERFAEDHLRMLRAARFAASLDFAMDPATAAAIAEHAAMAGSIAPERVREELVRLLLESTRAGDALELLDSVGLLDVILPEVTAMKGQEQPPQFHPEGDVYTHTVLMLNLMTERSLQLAFAILLHDVGKPLTMSQGEDRIRFDGHATKSAEMAEDIMHRLRFSRNDTDTVVYAIRNHMRIMDVQKMRESKLRKLLAAPSFPLEIELHRLDCLASHGGLDNYEFLLEFQSRLAAEPVLPERWVTGRDLIEMGLEEGPCVGAWLKRAYDAQLDNRFGGREEIIEWIRTEMADSSKGER